jgi:hypothetical protein
MSASDLVGKACPEVEYELLDGTTGKISELIANGKPTVLDFCE